MPELLIVAVIFFLARFATGLLKNFFDGVQSRRIDVSWLDADSTRPTRRLANIGVWVFAGAMAYPYIPGSETDAFKGLAVLLGLMVSIGAASTVGQAAVAPAGRVGTTISPTCAGAGAQASETPWKP